MNEGTSLVPAPTFCIIPWVHVFADEQGLMRPCCMAIGNRELANTDAEGHPHVVHREGGIEAGWNSGYMKRLRRAFLAGERPDVCTQCFKEEDLSIRSYRENSNVTFAAHIPEAMASTAADGSAPLRLVRSADLRLGNLCNLKCRMCSPVSSRLLIPEWKSLFGVADDDPRLAELDAVDWFETDAFWNNCEALLPQLDKLHFAGGEPLLIARMLDFLQRVIDAGRAPAITLSYVTNLTTLPERVTSLWPSFHAVKLTVSLDGFDRVNSYIRYPSRWHVIDANLSRLLATPDAFNCTQVTVNTTVQAYNVLTLTDLFEYLMSRRAAHFVPYPRLTLLHWPSAMSIRVLPPALKVLARDRLQAFVHAWQGRWPVGGQPLERFLASIDGVIAHMDADDRPADREEFARRTRFFDGSRNQDVSALVPELAPLLAPEAVSRS